MIYWYNYIILLFIRRIFKKYGIIKELTNRYKILIFGCINLYKTLRSRKKTSIKEFLELARREILDLYYFMNLHYLVN